MSCFVPPTIAQFKAQFLRDFPYAPGELANDTTDATLRKYIINQDIQNAINDAVVDFNEDLFSVNATQIFYYLAAHYLVDNIRNSSMGLNSQAKFPLESSSVGGVSINNSLCERLTQDANFAKYLTTGYGKKYLTLAYPYTVGAGIQTLPGRTTIA